MNYDDAVAFMMSTNIERELNSIAKDLGRLGDSEKFLDDISISVELAGTILNAIGSSRDFRGQNVLPNTRFMKHLIFPLSYFEKDIRAHLESGDFNGNVETYRKHADALRAYQEAITDYFG